MEEFQEYIQLFLIWLISTIVIRAILIRHHNNGDQHHQNPPNPPALPIIGHLHLISSLQHQTLHNLSARYGPIFQIFLGSFPCVVVSAPEIAKEFLKTHDSSFSGRFVKSSAQYYMTYGLKGLVLTPYGSYFKFMKKLCMAELLGKRTLDQLLPLRREETLRFLKLLQKKGEAGEAVDVSGEIITLTNSVISRMTMSVRCCEEGGDGLVDSEEIRKMVKDIMENAGKFNNISDFIWLFKNWDLHGKNKRVKEIRKRFDSMIERVIREHELAKKKMKEEGDTGGRVKDLLDILLDILEDNKKIDEIQLTKENIKALILDIFVAGTDTSATNIEWALAELINNPHVMEKARKEIDLITANNRLIQESDLTNLPYLQAIVKETLRLHPVLPLIARQSTSETSVNVCGYEIASKSLLFINLWSMGRNPKIWENPLEFRPERFIDDERQLSDLRGQNFQLLPFGTGRRVCPGASLALLTVPATLAAMIQCFEWKVDGNVSMEEQPHSGITLARAHPLICVPIPRFRQLSYLGEN
ncbi:hypothetical protein HN873_039790 [Arachis hypogaea]|nr:Cytochrome P450 [Arachis hypogaea]